MHLLTVKATINLFETLVKNENASQSKKKIARMDARKRLRAYNYFYRFLP